MKSRPEDRRFEEYRDCFVEAWTESARPSSISIQETFLASLESKPPERTELHALWIFFRGQIAQELPLNWYCDKRIAKRLDEECENLRRNDIFENIVSDFVQKNQRKDAARDVDK